MRLLIETGRSHTDAPAATAPVKKAASALSPRSWWPLIRESFAGAWQRNITVKGDELLAYPTLYACLNRIATDIGKLPFKLMQLQPDGLWQVRPNPAYDPVLRKPNHYQTQSQFRISWVLSRLIQGNTYVLKQRDASGAVRKLYVLNPFQVRPMVSESGDVFYEVWGGNWNGLNSLIPGLTDTVMIPAREIIHDRLNTFWHPLIGIPPLCAAYWPTVKNMKILRSAAEFFDNAAMPAGILTAPGELSNETADRLSAYFNENFTGDKAGNIAVVGDGLKFEAFSVRSVDSQMVEQLQYSDRQICQPFGIQPYKVGIGEIPAGMDVDDINQLYYSDALQGPIESIEELMADGLGMSGADIVQTWGVELDLEPLLRMDQAKLVEVEAKKVAGKIKTPNEARRVFGLPAIDGGDAIYGQQQDIPLAMIEAATKQKLLPPPAPAPAATPEPAPDDQARAFADALTRAFEAA
jgi:HK97 family phage portal protein